jgi:uncharacterized phage infection (PIP) family protein YhgE
MLRTA